MGALDYAGGTVVHINAGIAGLVACLMVGPRRGWGQQHLAPANLALAVIGASLLWFGWMGFNGGSGLAANERAVMAIIVTQIAAAAGAVAWMFTEWKTRGKPSLLGMISGAVAGLVAITPGSGFVEPAPALVIGLLAGLVCFFMVAVVKAKLGYDDSLDAFGVLGIQVLSVAATLVYGGVMSFVILFIIKKTMGLRVSTDDELSGLDLATHGERIE